MQIDADKMIDNALREGLREAIKSKLTQGYSNPLDKAMEEVVAEQRESVRSLIGEAIESCMKDQMFREDLKTSIRAVLAKTLVSRFGGELEKQVNTLKSDPATRARITLAIDEIVKQKTEA
jgi:hypothetical protein